MRALLVGVLLLASGVARGQAIAPTEIKARPWADGVSESAQTEAFRLFATANQFFEQGQYAQALAIYRGAVSVWDHPAIRYNMAVARIHLDQPLAAYEDLERAIQYGAEPLAPDAYSQALTYKKLLDAQLAHLRVQVPDPDVQVFLDGELVLTGPGRLERVMVPGAHQLVASKPTFVTETRALTLVAGHATEEVLRPIPVAVAIAAPPMKRRWAEWKPWAVVGAGAGVAILGIPLQLVATSTMREYDDEVATMCPFGCMDRAVPQDVRDLKSRARVENGLAIGCFVAGAAVVAGGAVMVLLNQPRPVIAPGSVDGKLGLVWSGTF